MGDAADLRAQRPLRFTQTSYPFAILNTASINDVVGIVRAVPEDANNELTYSMDTSAEFSITVEAEADNPSKVGQISVKAVLSLDTTYTLNVEVMEAGGGTATVEVRIQVDPALDADEDGLIEVSTLEQLNAIRYDLDGNGTPTTAGMAEYTTAFGTETCTDCTGYELMNNLNFNDSNNDGTANDPSKWAEGCMSSCVTGTQVNGTAGNTGWEPIGTETDPFTGIFDGNDHTTSNLYINRQVMTFHAGLFGFIKGASSVAPATLESLNLRDVNVKIDGDRSILGGLVGVVSSNSNIMLCSVTGTVFASSDDDSTQGGGLVGANSGSITSCYATGDVTITSTSADGSYGGGLVGGNSGSGSITASYATGDVTATGSVARIGGLVGQNSGSITSCYAAGDVTATAYGGGLVGLNSDSGSITASYATGDVSSSTTATTLYGGGLVGRNEATATITNSYYNDGATITGGGNTDGTQTKSALQTPTTAGTGIYQTWGVVWDFGTNIQYPALKVDFDGDGNATVTEFGPQRSAKFKSPTHYFYVNADAAVNAVVNTVRASVVRNVYSLGYSILSQKIGEDAATTSGFAFAITDKDEDGIKVGELTVATVLIPVELYTLSIQVDDDNGGMDLTEVRIEVSPGRPAAPTNLTATAVSETQINLSWEVPSQDGGEAITGYDLEYSEDGSIPWVALTTSGTMTTFSDDTELTRGTTRHYRVAAINSVGTGASSEQASATTHDVPDAPKNLTATPGEKQVTLSWEVPANGGKAITHYAIKIADTRDALGSSGAVQVAVTEVTGGDGSAGTNVNYVVTMTGVDSGTPLVNNTEYFFQVAAVNSVDTGEYSASGSATPGTSAPPAVPASLTVTPGDAKMTLSWEVPANGGDPITHYAIKIADTREALGSFAAVQVAVAEVTGDDTSVGANVNYIVTMTGVNSGTALVNGTTYFFQIAAVNSIGTGNYTNTIDATTTVPDAPTNLTATAVSDTQISLSWDAPSQDGGAAITGYDLEYSTDGNEPWTDLTTSVTTTSFSDNTGLTLGSTRHYRVAAINNVGTGEYSTTTDATTATATPGAPTNLTAISVSDTQIDLSWDAPSEDGGDAITGYDLEYSADGNEPWTDLTTSVTTTSFDDTGLTIGNTRHYRVAAINAVGTGDYSEEASATASPVVLSVPLEVEDGPGVYPNPGSDKVYVNLPNGNGAYVVRLHTLAGKVVLQKQLQGGGTRTLSLSKLQNGVYILNVQKDGQSSSYRLIKATH